MKNLEQEAEEYAVEMLSKMENRATARILEDYAKKDFMAGATSHWVETQKINAQIELLYQARVAPITWFDRKMEELEQQLKELENEN